MKFKSIIGTVTLTSQRRNHILLRHPIMELYLQGLRLVLESPRDIRFSNYSDNVLLFYRYFDNIEGGKYIVGVISKDEKQVLTAYLTHRIKSGRKYYEEGQ